MDSIENGGNRGYGETITVSLNPYKYCGGTVMVSESTALASNGYCIHVLLQRYINSDFSTAVLFLVSECRHL